MKRLGLVSDTHGDFRHVGAARIKIGRIDWLLHAGDHFADADRVARSFGVQPQFVRAVVGNCCAPLMEPSVQMIELEGVKILLTHGHHFGVKSSLERIYYRGVEAGARVVVFGHTHIPYLEDDGKVMLFNPGSLHRPHLPTDAPSLGVLDVENGEVVTAQHIFVR